MNRKDVIPFRAGETYRWSNTQLEYKIHIVSVIDEGLSNGAIIVFRYYGKHRQWWHYECKSAYLLTGEIKQNAQ